ncbi:MAG: type III pantothenate kinase [Nitrococcus mobilis]|nr:type III pantothenate kinase [Nitrococcus mobilis]
MKLLLDIGNSRIKWACAEGGRLVGAAAALSHGGAVPGELLASWAVLHAPSGGVLGVSVAAPRIAREIGAWVERHWVCHPQWLITPRAGGGIQTAYPQPAALGADRWAAMVAARHRGLLPACIVDCGTAVTLDAIDGAGRHLGGVIVPGLGAMRRSLTERAHQLPAVGDGCIEALAKDTLTGIRSGTVLGLAALIDGLVDRLTERSGLSLQPLLTGGDAALLLPWLTRPYEHAPNLTLEGLAVLAAEGS